MSRYRDAPSPNYDYDVNKIVKAYEKALQDVQAELNSLFLTDFERAQIIAVEDNIRFILTDLRKYGDEWAKQTITKASKNGIASTIYSLGLAETFDEALKIVEFSGVNREFARSMIADTQSDLLAVTQNVDRRTRSAIRRATADALRSKTASGITGIQSTQEAITKEIRKRLRESADSAIIDAAGRRWKLRTYTEMLARTKSMEAHKESTINEALERDVQYGIISTHFAEDDCRKWEGKIVSFLPDGDYPYIEDLPRNEIFHPNCKHVISPVKRLDRLPDKLRKLNNI